MSNNGNIFSRQQLKVYPILKFKNAGPRPKKVVDPGTCPTWINHIVLFSITNKNSPLSSRPLRKKVELRTPQTAKITVACETFKQTACFRTDWKQL